MKKTDNADQLLRAMTDVKDEYIEDAARFAEAGQDQSAQNTDAAFSTDGRNAGGTGAWTEGGNDSNAASSGSRGSGSTASGTHNKKHKTLRFRRTVGIISAVAACLVVGVVAVSLTGVVRMGSSSSSSYVTSADRSGGTYNALSESAVEDSSDYAMATAENADLADESSSDNGLTGSTNSAYDTTDSAEDIQKKIVYTGYVSIDTKAYDDTRSQLSDLIAQYGGFIESSNEYDSGSDEVSSRSYDVTAKIPSENFNSFMNGLGDLTGKVTSKSISSSDMTRTYSDNADRIEALETEQQALLDLLAKADSVDSMIAIQSELTDIRAELAQLHHENSGIDYDVQYSSVSISVYEVSTYEPQRVGFAERLQDALGSSGQAFLHVLQGIAIGIVYLLPYIIIAAVIFFIVRAVRRRRHKN